MIKSTHRDTLIHEFHEWIESCTWSWTDNTLYNSVISGVIIMHKLRMCSRDMCVHVHSTYFTWTSVWLVLNAGQMFGWIGQGVSRNHLSGWRCSSNWRLPKFRLQPWLITHNYNLVGRGAGGRGEVWEVVRREKTSLVQPWRLERASCEVAENTPKSGKPASQSLSRMHHMLLKSPYINLSHNSNNQPTHTSYCYSRLVAASMVALLNIFNSLGTSHP